MPLARARLRRLAPLILAPLLALAPLVLGGLRTRAQDTPAVEPRTVGPRTIDPRLLVGGPELARLVAAQALPDAGAPVAEATPEESTPPAAEPASTPAAEPSSGPEEVTVGLYLHHVPELDLHSSSYLADFYLWFRWTGSIDPTDTYELVNLVDGWDVMRTPLFVNDAGEPEADTLPDGSHYQCFHVQGRFGHPFDVHAYPFDAQDLVIQIEDGEHLERDLVYRIDPGTRQIHPEMQIAGWGLGTPEPEVISSHYATNFGDTRNDPSGDSYSQFRYSLRVERPVMGAFVKTVVPIAVVMLITLLMLLIESKYFEGRLGLGITSLISAVALQLTAAADLPTTGYLVLLDHIYNAAYVVIFVALLESVVSVKLADDGHEARARKLDVVSLGVLTFAFFGTVTYLFVTR